MFVSKEKKTKNQICFFYVSLILLFLRTKNSFQNYKTVNKNSLRFSLFSDFFFKKKKSEN